MFSAAVRLHVLVDLRVRRLQGNPLGMTCTPSAAAPRGMLQLRSTDGQDICILKMARG